MALMPLRDFLRQHPGMALVDATKPIPEALLKRVADGECRLVLAVDGLAVGAVVGLSDLDLLEITDHGLQVLEEPVLQG